MPHQCKTSNSSEAIYIVGDLAMAEGVWGLSIQFFYKTKICVLKKSSPGQVGQIVGVLPYTPKVYEFDSRSGHISRLQIQSLVRVCMGGNL